MSNGNRVTNKQDHALAAFLRTGIQKNIYQFLFHSIQLMMCFKHIHYNKAKLFHSFIHSFLLLYFTMHAAFLVIASFLPAGQNHHSFLSSTTTTNNNRATWMAAAASSSVDAISSSLQRSPKYENLLDWLACQDAEISSKIEIRESIRGGGYGAFVNDDVRHDELLFTIPRAACITLSDALQDPSCGKAFQNLMQKAGPGSETVVMAGFLALERLKCTNSSSSSSSRTPSPYKAYLETLSWSRGDNNQEHILFWEEDEVERRLEGSMCYGEAIDLRKEVQLAIRVLERIIGKAIQNEQPTTPGNNDPGFQWPWQRKREDVSRLPPVEGLAEAIEGAFVILLTRAFQDNESHEKLVPLLDLLQHADEPNISHIMRKADGTVEVRARRDLQTGDELLNQYRSELEDTIPYHRFFTRFGFVPGIQEPIQNLLDDRSSIFFAQKAEV